MIAPDTDDDHHDPRLYAPATLRNREPILAVLRRIVPSPTLGPSPNQAPPLILEIASGSGEHLTFFAGHFPHVEFQPSDGDPHARASIAGWTAALGLANVRPPMVIDARQLPLGADTLPADLGRRPHAILSINMIHIAPWPAAEGLVAGAGALLDPGGWLYLYGPFKRDGAHTGQGNADFDQALRDRDPLWGVRDLEAVAALADAAGFAPPEIVAMPADNLSVLFRRL
jgi:hypothetical protein